MKPSSSSLEIVPSKTSPNVNEYREGKEINKHKNKNKPQIFSAKPEPIENMLRIERNR
jgi:hypothetical protein